MKKILLAFFTVFILSGASQAQQSQPENKTRPLYNEYEVETLKPDSTPDDSKVVQAMPEFMVNNLHFQLADPKGISLEDPQKVIELRRAVDLKIQEEEARKKAEEEKRLAELKKQEEAKRKAEEEKRLAELKKQEEARRKAEEEKRLAELKKQEKQKHLEELQKQKEAEKQAEEEKRLAELKKQEDAKKQEEEVFFTKEDIKESVLTKDTGYKVEDISLKTDVYDENKLRITPPETKEVTDTAEKSEPKKEIDYYLQKYSSTLEGEANKESYNHSLMTPFRDSFFYKVLKDNRYEDIELKTVDVTSDFKPEAVVSYNAPQGAEGEYACQVLVLEPDGPSLSKLWISELIPGEIDTVYTQDINNDGQNDIVVISTTGGVSLLKSIRVYSYDKARKFFNTIFAMNGIMEGLVDVRNGKILVSETFPGGVNRAALYMWNGRRFERLEL